MKNKMLIVLAGIFLISCGTPHTKEKKVPVSPMPAPVLTEERLEELPVSPIEEEMREERLFSLSFRDADVKEILSVLSRKGELNIIVDPDVEGMVTVDLKKVTLSEALECLLTPLGLVYQRKGDLIRVSKPKMETRLFTLNYLVVKRTGSGVVSGIGGRDGEEGAQGGSATGGSFIRVQTEGITDLWTDLEEGLKNITSKEGKIVVNKLSGAILVTDFPQNLSRMAEFLERIEGSAQRQVTIEAKILEVALSEQYQMGLDWAAISKIGSIGGALSGGMVAAQTLLPLVPGTSQGNMFQLGISDSDFSVFLDAISRQGEVNILSSPRVCTLNNQPAIIKVAREDVYWEREFSYGYGSGGAEGQAFLGFSRPKWITIGILLGVTPQIGPDGWITMDIHPSVTEKVGESVSGEGDVAPILDVRETSTVVKVRDGQTIVIAGLLQEREDRTVVGVPLLRRLPVFGWLFRKTIEERKKTELVIMLTPKIVVGKAIGHQSVVESAARWQGRR